MKQTEVDETLARSVLQAQDSIEELERKHGELTAAFARQVEMIRDLTRQVRELNGIVKDMAIRDHDDGK